MPITGSDRSREEANMKAKIFQTVAAVALAGIVAVTASVSPSFALKSQASDEIPNNYMDVWGDDTYPAFFDIDPRVAKVKAGDSLKLNYFYSHYDYTYFITGATSSKTYCECGWKAGTTQPIIHIGEDERGGNVFFYFYVDDRNFPGMTAEDIECYASVEIYVQPASGTKTAPSGQTVVSKSNAAPLKGSKKDGTISLIRDDTVEMLYDAKGAELASFSVSDGSGTMPKLIPGGVVQSDGNNYFTVNTKNKKGVVKISESDKAVMIAKGYAGVCLNGTCVNWP